MFLDLRDGFNSQAVALLKHKGFGFLGPLEFAMLLKEGNKAILALAIVQCHDKVLPVLDITFLDAIENSIESGRLNTNIQTIASFRDTGNFFGEFRLRHCYKLSLLGHDGFLIER
jgi:hypothetical protein